MKPSLFDSALAAEGVTGPLADLARSIYTQESSRGRNTKTSNRGAKGGMQVLDGTFAEVADAGWSIDNEEHNARAGIRYLKKMSEYGGGDPKLAAVGYYGGKGGINKARRGVAVSDPKNPRAPNTLQYADQVVGRLGSQPSLSQVAAAPAAQAAPDLQVAAGPVALPPEIMAQLAYRPPTAPRAESKNTWIEFLNSMPQSKQPVNVNDIDYANPQVATHVPRFQYQPAEVKPVNFEAFSAWKGRA